MVRTRFSPSPTGMLHIGSARVALYCWLYARRNNGQYILRIEDTDQERSTQEAVDVILEGLNWLGIDHDEGPFYQTQHLDRYNEILEQLLQSGYAYYCDCTKERLDEVREQQKAQNLKPRYDHHCRDLNLGPGEDRVVRFANPLDGVVTFTDAVLGEIRIANEELDDFIIRRTDGYPTYNFSVVVDDVDMRISHVIRGNDHVNNTPKQINLMHALGATPPVFAHLPLILGDDGKKLSKRHGALSVLEYRDQGYLPQALLNYLLRLGWSHGDEEIFSIERMMQLFDLDHVSKSPAQFDAQKSLWINQQYIKNAKPDDLVGQVQRLFDLRGIATASGPELSGVIAAQLERAKTLDEMVDKSLFFYQPVEGYDEKAFKKHVKPEFIPAVRYVYEQFVAISAWEKAGLHQIILDSSERFAVKLGKVAQPIRLALTGGTVSPPLDITLELLGRETVLQRFKDFFAQVDSTQDDMS
jgi:glutamyl-tRNA synthetase